MPLPLVSRSRPLKRRGTAEDRSVDLLPIGVALAVTLVAAAGLAAVLLLGAFAWLGPPAVGPGGVGLTALLDIIKIALAVVGGIGGAVALVVAYRRQRLAEEDNLRARQAARRDDTKLFNERFATATGQLGNDSAAVRLAGVHALAALADDWAGGRQMCIDVMCAYLRLPQRPEPGPGGAANAHTAWQAMGEVRATIWRLITIHLHKDAAISWHGADLDLTGITITTDLDFTDTLFPSGTVRFNQANFSAGTVNFREAKFSGGEVHFIGAKFSGSTVDFHRAEFSGGTVDFHGAKFSAGTVDFTKVHDWSHPAVGLPERARGLRLPPPVAGEPTSRHE